jgi:ubiquinone/menaquinone biosynthesis C-methylase UbiE
MTDDLRYKSEREFHDRIFSDGSRAVADKFYFAAEGAKRFYERVLVEGPPGEALEYGCGRGSHAHMLARAGWKVVGIDISPEAIRQAGRRSEAEGLTERVSFRVMNAERLELPDASVDLIYGSGILHHLDLNASLGEVARVLRPDGRAVFLEPLGHNPLINLYRRRTPGLRTADEHPLRMEELRGMRRHFERVDVTPFHLTVLATVPFRERRWFEPARTALDVFDRLLFRLPGVGRLAWQVTLVLRRPRQA